MSEAMKEQNALAIHVVNSLGECSNVEQRALAERAALAAIQATTERAASWLEQYPSPMDDLDLAMRIRGICDALRRGNHLK